MNALPVFHKPGKIDQLDKIQDGIFVLNGESKISIDELMSDKFIVENTDFNSLTEFFNAARVKNNEDLQKKEFDDFIKSHTRFENWEEMLVQSSNQFVSKYFSSKDNQTLL